MKAIQRREISYRQLCAIAATVLRHEAALDEAAWSWRIRIELLAEGYTYPDPWITISRAMRNVEAASARQHGARPFRPVSRITIPRDAAGDLRVDLHSCDPQQLHAIRRGRGTAAAILAIARAEYRDLASREQHARQLTAPDEARTRGWRITWLADVAHDHRWAAPYWPTA